MMTFKEHHERVQKENWYLGLNDDQKAFIKFFFEGHNIFLTGPAGTGKSFVQTKLFEYCESNEIRIAKTATTGISALNIGGSTIHSFSGVGTGEENLEYLIKKIRNNKKVAAKINGIRVLFIDEISMMHHELFSKLNAIFKSIRGVASKPFGGVQIILSGDFLQLPAVEKNSEEYTQCFISDTWVNANIKIVKLEKVMRQKDAAFAECLNKIRYGDLSDIDLLLPCINRKINMNGVEPVELFSKKKDVASFNTRRLYSIKEPEKVFTAYDQGSTHQIADFHQHCPATKDIILKKGAQVILVYNISLDEGLVNGSTGVVEDFCTSTGNPIVKFTNGVTCVIGPVRWEKKEETPSGDYVVTAFRQQIPLKLGYAATIHSRQGSTLPCVRVDLAGCFAPGQAYTALSRVQTLDGLSIKSHHPKKIDESAFITDDISVRFYKAIDDDMSRESSIS